MNRQLLRDRFDRLPLRRVLVLMFEHHPHRPLAQLIGILPTPLRSCHDSILSRAGASTDPGGIQPGICSAIHRVKVLVV
jgi:hypothetical protein